MSAKTVVRDTQIAYRYPPAPESSLGFAKAFRNWWWLILIVVVATTTATGVLTQVRFRPTYTSSQQVLVSSSNSSSSATDISNNLQLMSTFQDFYSNQQILNRVNQQNGNKYSLSRLIQGTSVEHSSGSLVMSVSMTLDSSEDARRYLDSLLEEASKAIHNQFPTVKVANFISSSPIEKKGSAPITRNCVIAFGSSVVLMLLLVLLLPSRDSSSKSRHGIHHQKR